MLVTEPFAAVTRRAKIECGMAAFTAIKASEKQTLQANSTPITERSTAFNYIEEGENFVEIQTPIAVTVKCPIKVGIIEQPVAPAPEEVDELLDAHCPVSINIQGLEKCPCQLLLLLSSSFVIG